MAFAATMPPIWPIRPDWAYGVQESLAWRTEVLRASATAVTNHRSLRLTPRRSFAFRVLAGAQAKRVAAMLLDGNAGPWLLPIWTDIERLPSPVPAGELQLPCDTAGCDFVAGGRALLYTDATRWTVLDIDQVMPDHLQLAAATPAPAAAAGTRLYPLRRALLNASAEETHRSDNVSRRALAFDIAEACDWPGLAALEMYRGHPVLTVRPDESSDPVSAHERQVAVVDYGTALPFVHDLSGISLRSQRSYWKLAGRPRHTWFRSLAYTLSGRCTPMWVPSWSADLQPVGAAAAAGLNLVVEWAGYTLYGFGRPNRADLRIELRNGTVLYRRVVAASAAGNTETLVLDQPVAGGALAAAQIRMVSFLALCTLASDEVEIDHLADARGVAKATLSWQAVVPDGP